MRTNPEKQVPSKRRVMVRKIILAIFALLCLGGAAAMVFMAMLSPTYQTEAKLLVRYVVERSSIDNYESKSDASGSRGIDLMAAELEIITSYDVALAVANAIGPEKILTSSDPPPTGTAAAMQIAKNLDVVTTGGSNVIHLKYRHPDPKIAVEVLKQLIDTYFERHVEIHRNTGAFESVARQTDVARSRLSETEAHLSKLSAESGFLSLSDARTFLEKRRNAMHANLMDAQVELTEQQVKVASLETAMRVEPLAQPNADANAADEATPVGQTPAVQAERAKLEALQAKNKMLAEQLAQLDNQVERVSASSLEFANLERQRQSEEEKYRASETNLDNARVDETLKPSSMPNISVVQNPSPPVRSIDGATKLIATGLAAVGLLALLRIVYGGKAPGKAGTGPEGGKQG